MYLLAQQSTSSRDWVEAVSANGLWIFVAVVCLGGVACSIVSQILNHRTRLLEHEERMAMIQAGMHPDSSPPGVEQLPSDLRETFEHNK